MIPFTENSRKCQLIYSDREQTSGCREQGGTEEGGGGREGLQTGSGNVWG